MVCLGGQYMQQMLYKGNAEGDLTTVEKKVMCPKGRSLEGCGLEPPECLLVASRSRTCDERLSCGTSPDDNYILAS